jgi:amino acid permease
MHNGLPSDSDLIYFNSVHIFMPHLSAGGTTNLTYVKVSQVTFYTRIFKLFLTFPSLYYPSWFIPLISIFSLPFNCLSVCIASLLAT